MNSNLIDTLVERSETLWKSWCEAARADELSIPDDADFIHTLKQVWEGSDYVAQSCLRDPTLLTTFLENGDLLKSYPAGSMAQQLQEQLSEVADEAMLAKVLR